MFNLVRSITQIFFSVCGYNILPKFVNQLIASSIQIIQIDSRHVQLCSTIRAYFVTYGHSCFLVHFVSDVQYNVMYSKSLNLLLQLILIFIWSEWFHFYVIYKQNLNNLAEHCMKTVFTCLCCYFFM